MFASPKDDGEFLSSLSWRLFVDGHRDDVNLLLDNVCVVTCFLLYCSVVGRGSTGRYLGV